MKYDVDYFIKKFEAIPRGKWNIKHFNNHSWTKFCALGHCGVVVGYYLNPEAEALVSLFPDYGDVEAINDGRHKKYQQLTPKGRILAALKDIKKAQND